MVTMTAIVLVGTFVVIVTMNVPTRTIAQLLSSERKISEMLGLCLRAKNSSVSARDFLSLKRKGMMMQPSSKGIRHPQFCIVSGGRMEFRTTPTEAANITATCWLPDCQLTQKPL